MLDFNHRPAFHERVTGFIDAALDVERAGQIPRDYLGASRLGVACERALQYEYAGAPVDPGRGFSGRILRVFEVGHVLEDLAVRWLRMAGFILKTEGKDGQQFGFSVADGNGWVERSYKATSLFGVGADRTTRVKLALSGNPQHRPFVRNLRVIVT